MVKRWFILFLLVQLFTNAQSRFIDSLKKVIYQSQVDSVRLSALNILTMHFSTNNLDSANKYALFYIEQAKKTGYKRAMARGYVLMGDILEKKGDYAGQIVSIQKALVLMEEGKDITGMMRVNGFLSEAFLKTNDLDNALVHAKKSLEYYSSLGVGKSRLKGIEPRTNNILGSVYLKKNNAAKALSYFELAYDAAVAEKYNDWYIASILENTGEAYFQQNDLKNARKYYSKALALNKHLNSVTGINSSYAGLAAVHKAEGSTDSALVMLERAEKNALKMEDRTALLRIYDQYIHVYDKMGNTKKKADYLELKLSLRDSLNSVSSNAALADAKIKLRNYEKERENALLNERNKVLQLEAQKTRNKIFIGAAVAVFILLVLLFRNKYNKLFAQKTNMELEHKLFRSQMNPHFVFNSLSTIQSFVLSEDSMKAAKHLSVFSMLVRKTLDNSRREFILFDEEIETAKLYLELESIRMDRPFQYCFDYETEQVSGVMVPPMLIQPHLENAIKHGIKNLPLGIEGIIHVSFEMRKKDLFCIIEDNGIGIKAAVLLKNAKENHKSTGMEVTQSRLKLLCANMKKKFVYDVKDKSDATKDKGTIVEFNLPYRT